MKRFFLQDKALVGIVAVAASELLAAAILWSILTLIHYDLLLHLRWFAAAFIPGLLAMRFYMKQRQYLTSTKAAITTFFVTFLAFMIVLIKGHMLNY